MNKKRIPWLALLSVVKENWFWVAWCQAQCMNTHISVTSAHYSSPCGFTWGSITAVVRQTGGGEVEDIKRPLGCADTRLYEWIKKKHDATALQFNLSLPQRRVRQYVSLWSMKQRWCLQAKWAQLKGSLAERFISEHLHYSTSLKSDLLVMYFEFNCIFCLL